MFVLLITVKILLFFITLSISAFFSGTETALLSSSTSVLTKIKDKCKQYIKYIEIWEKDPSLFLSSIILGTNLANIACGVLATSMIIDFSSGEVLLKWIIFPLNILLVLIFGEILPKVYSRYKSEEVLVLTIGIMGRFTELMGVPSKFLVKVAEKILRIFKTELNHETPFFTGKELKSLLFAYSSVNRDAPPDAIKEQESRMMSNILSFVDQKVSHVMIPANKIFAVDLNRNVEEIIKILSFSKYSRIPVYNKTIDNIIGIIYKKDIIMMVNNRELFKLDDLIRPVNFIPDNISVSDMLREFRKGKYHMAIVVNEYGNTVGLITIEDIVEEIVGEIYNEYDIKRKGIISIPDGSWLISGDETLKNINTETGILIGDNDVATINGYIIKHIGRIPVNEEILEIDKLLIKIIDADKKRIKKVQLRERK